MNDPSTSNAAPSPSGPDAPFGVGGLIGASLLTALFAGAWWFILILAHCGIDAGGGPPLPPGPSSFGLFDLAYALVGAVVVTGPVLLCRIFTESERLRIVALRVALIPCLLIGYLTVMHLTGGSGYWTSAC